MKKTRFTVRVIQILTALRRWFAAPAVIAALLLFCGSSANAAPSQKFNYQGNLRQGGFLVNGTKNMKFRIYSSSFSLTALWTSPDPGYSVQITTGVFRTALDTSGLDWEAAGAFWLEIEVEGVKLSPREEITSVPFAIDSALHSGKKYTTSLNAPPSPATGDLWMDTTPGASSLKFYNGAWVDTVLSGIQSAHAVMHAGAGIDPIVSLGTYTVTGSVSFGPGARLTAGAGEAGIYVSTNLYVEAGSKYYGDGSALGGVVQDAGDTMTGTLVMNAASAFNTTAQKAIAFSTNVYISGSQFRLGNFAGAPPAGDNGAGSVYYNTGDGTLYVSNGSAWSPLAAGGISPWTSGGGNTTLVSAGDKVGIGKAPSEKLDVAGNIKADYGVTAATAVFTNTGASALDVAGGINAGTGNVGIIGTDGRIPALSGTYFTNMSGANITGLNAANMGAGAVDDTRFGYLSNVTSDIQAQINTKAVYADVKNATTTIAGGLATEITDRTNADSGLSGRLDTVATDTTTLNNLAAHLAGAETITGIKTFGANPVFNAGAVPQGAVAGLANDLILKATDTYVVHLAGAENITGAKTFTAAPTINNVSFNLTGAAGLLVGQSSITTSGGLFAERATLTSGLAVTGGYVGIGTASPANDLSFGPNSDRTIKVTDRDDGNMGAGGSLTISAGTAYSVAPTAGGSIYLSAGGSSGSGSPVNGGSIVLNGGARNGMEFSVDGNVVLANLRGFVGIGTASPAQKLEVAGTVKATDAQITYGITAATLTLSNTGASALDVAGGIRAGGVNIINTNGKIPALSGSYLADLSGASLTSIPQSAIVGLANDLSLKATDTLVVHLAGAESVTGIKTFTAAPAITAAGGLGVTYNITAGSVTITNNGANALDVAGGIKAGGVNIIGTDGRIPAFNSAYFANLGVFDAHTAFISTASTKIDAIGLFIATAAAKLDATGLFISTATTVIDAHTAFISTATSRYQTFLTTATSIIDAHEAFRSTATTTIDAYGAALSTGVYLISTQTVTGAKTFTSPSGVSVTWGVTAASASFTSGITASSVTAFSYTLAANVVVSSESTAALGAGVRVSSNVYVVGFSSANAYYGDGSHLTGIVASSNSITIDTPQTVTSTKTFTSTFTVTAAGGVWSPAVSMASNVMMSSASAAQYGGVTVSTNIYVAGKYYGDGTALTFGSASAGPVTFSTNVVISASQLRIGNYASVGETAAGALGAGAIFYNTGNSSLYVSNGVSWTQLASGGASAWSTSGGVTFLTSPGDLVSISSITLSSITFTAGVVMTSATASNYGGIYLSTHIALAANANYYGDGSGLTNLPSSQLSGGIPQSLVNLSTVASVVGAHEVFRSTATSYITAWNAFASTGPAVIGAHTAFISTATTRYQTFLTTATSIIDAHEAFRSTATSVITAHEVFRSTATSYIAAWNQFASTGPSHIGAWDAFSSTATSYITAWNAFASTGPAVIGAHEVFRSSATSVIDAYGVALSTGVYLASTQTVTGQKVFSSTAGVTVTYGVSAATMVVTNTAAGALDVEGGIQAGSGHVGIIGTDGRIPALSGTYIADLSAANLTGIPSSQLSGGIAQSLINLSTVTSVLGAHEAFRSTGSIYVGAWNQFASTGPSHIGAWDAFSSTATSYITAWNAFASTGPAVIGAHTAFISTATSRYQTFLTTATSIIDAHEAFRSTGSIYIGAWNQFASTGPSHIGAWDAFSSTATSYITAWNAFASTGPAVIGAHEVFRSSATSRFDAYGVALSTAIYTVSTDTISGEKVFSSTSGVRVTYGVVAASASFSGGVTASSLTVVGTGGLKVNYGINASTIGLNAGTATAAPLVFTAGTNLTNTDDGAVEYDGAGFYETVDSTAGRTLNSNQMVFRLTADGASLGPTIDDYFGTNSAFGTVTNGVYEITYYLFYTKATAGTVTYTITNTQTYTNIAAEYVQSGTVGIGTSSGTISAGIDGITTAAAALPATQGLSAATHRAVIRAVAECATAGNIRLRVTSSAGTVAPLRGSYYTVRRLTSGNVGYFWP